MEENENVVIEQQWHHLISIEDVGGLNRKVYITYDMEGVNMALDKATDIVAKKVQVNGFRKGKAPKSLVARTYKDKVKEMAGSLLSQEGFLHACYEQKLAPISEPKIEKYDFNVDGTFSCTILLEIKPEIFPVGYLGMELSKPYLDIEKIKINILNDLNEQHKRQEVRNIIEEGFLVTLDFWIINVENKEIINHVNDYKCTIKTNSEPPFGANLLGIKMNEMASCSMKLPEEYPEHGGKDVEIKMQIKLVQEVVNLSKEELIEKLQLSVEGFEIFINNKAKEIISQQERQYLEEQIVDKLIDLHEFEVPEKWVDSEKQFLLKQLNMVNPDENMLNMATGMAMRNVKRTFILESIYENEKGLVLTQEEIDKFFEIEAQKNGLSSLQLKEEVKKNNMTDGVLAVIKQGKIMNLILSQAKIIVEELKENCNCKQNCEEKCGVECDCKVPQKDIDDIKEILEEVKQDSEFKIINSTELKKEEDNGSK